MEVNVEHKRMTTEECRKNIRKLNQEYPGVFIDADEWENRHRKERG